MTGAVLVVFFALSALAALVALAAVDPRTVPPITGTCALILTLAALGAAVLR
ncbi:hypothetical protein [Streptomyces sp. CRN 30]|uniref:hypothetical protein n=1 Tax=Streptomyces sp. CRN 30 TaxID=3075613 RepID=UPI002A7F7D19|nr:hypothetical protein [Streptomyces sp. CRN 30]